MRSFIVINKFSLDPKMDNNSLCFSFLFHGTYYCDDCEWESLQDFSCVQMSLGITVILLSICALLAVSYRGWTLYPRTVDAFSELGLFYWAATCLGGVFSGIAHVAETSTLAAGVGPSEVGDKISHVFMTTSVNACIVLEAVYAIKFLLAAWKLTLFRHKFPPLWLIIADWCLVICGTVAGTVIAYLRNQWFMKWIKPAQMVLEWTLLGVAVILALSLTIYSTMMITRFCNAQQSSVWLSRNAKRMFRAGTVRNALHIAMLATVVIMYLALLIVDFYYSHVHELTNEACIAWLIPYKLLTILFWSAKGVTAVWTFPFCTAENTSRSQRCSVLHF